MSATTTYSRILDAGGRLRVADGRLYVGPRDRIADLLDEIRERRRPLILLAKIDPNPHELAILDTVCTIFETEIDEVLGDHGATLPHPQKAPARAQRSGLHGIYSPVQSKVG